MAVARFDGWMNSSRELKGAEEGERGIWSKVEREEVGADIALGGLESRGETQARQIENLAVTSACNCNFRTESPLARDEIIKTGLN